MGFLWIIGVVLVITASSGSSVGIILMKKSFGDTGEHLTCWDTLIWMGGLAMMICGAILDFVAFGFAAQSLIAPLGSVTLICNVILAPLMLGEKVKASDWVASIVIATGCTVAIAFGDHDTKTYKFDDLMQLYHSAAVIAYLPLVGTITVACFVVNYCIEKPAVVQAQEQLDNEIALSNVKIDRNELAEEAEASEGVEGVEEGVQLELPGGFMLNMKDDQEDGAALEEAEPLSPTAKESTAKGSPQEEKAIQTDGEEEDRFNLTPQRILPFIQSNLRLFHGFNYAAAGGLSGSCSVMFGKSIAEIVKPCFTEGDASGWKRYETYLILLAMACTLFVQMKGLNMGLEFHPAVFIVPVYQTFWIMGSIIGGGIYFQEFSGLDALSVAMFCTGVGFTITGVYILTYFRWDEETAKFNKEFGLANDDSQDTPKHGEDEVVPGVAVSDDLRSSDDVAPDQPPTMGGVRIPNPLNPTPSPDSSLTDSEDAAAEKKSKAEMRKARLLKSKQNKAKEEEEEEVEI